jgi:hypothetical protein
MDMLDLTPGGLNRQPILTAGDQALRTEQRQQSS